MSSKHDTLTSEEMGRFKIHPAVLDLIRAHTTQRERPAAARPLRILDWGCGRGRAVAMLRDEGFDAFGVDTDRAVMRNGYELFRSRGLDPVQLLRHPEEAIEFEDSSFDIIFSEETLEHITDLKQVARETFRLLKPGGLAVHSFPGSRWLAEPHVHMPLVHWLPQGSLRRLLIRLCLLLGLGPRPPWPEAGGGLQRKIEVYDRYLAEKTAYRPRDEVMAAFARAGFAGRWLGDAPAAGWRRLLPAFLRDNGFPSGHLLLHLVKPRSVDSLTI